MFCLLDWPPRFLGLFLLLFFLFLLIAFAEKLVIMEWGRLFDFRGYYSQTKPGNVTVIEQSLLILMHLILIIVFAHLTFTSCFCAYQPPVCINNCMKGR